MKLIEALEKPFLIDKEDNANYSSVPNKDEVEYELDDVSIGFFDNELHYFNESVKQKNTKKQNALIESYRKIASTPEVAEVIDIIVDEATFSPGSTDLLSLDFDEKVPDALIDKINGELKLITKSMNLNKTIYSLLKTYYIDGQLNIHCAYNNDDINQGILKVKVLSPFGLQYNKSKNIWEYNERVNKYDTVQNKQAFDKEEVIRVDSGIYSENLILSNLHNSIKSVNMLTTLEDMLIPMRFTRSVSRRIFNLDVSKLNNKQVEEVMKKTQTKFAYKRFYDLNSGTISNQQHVSSLIEDYWFPNRSGERGTTVDTIDETGNLGEIEDILYFKRKLYSSLKVPVNRLNDEGESNASFDYTDSSINREELKFFNFISRIRNNFLEIFYELLKRSLISKEISTKEEWEELEELFKIKFTSENAFFEKMEREKLSESLNLFNDVEELIGKYFSYEYVYKKVFKFSDEDIKNMSEQLEREKTDPIYKRFYNKDEDDQSW